MPELGTQIAEGDVIELNVPYEIVNVEDGVITEVRGLSGVRVSFLSVDAEEGSLMLWKRPVTGEGSKLGAFITLLGSNTDHWLHKWVIFRSWIQGGRKVELTTAPVEKATKVTTGKGVEKALKETEPETAPF